MDFRAACKYLGNAALAKARLEDALAPASGEVMRDLDSSAQRAFRPIIKPSSKDDGRRFALKFAPRILSAATFTELE